ncbi:hypothetical protein TNCV_4362161 [Trichonephila clavipes]|nr:hypothetical protein TNCV_4362161 [Trichonephila clavipes]
MDGGDPTQQLYVANCIGKVQPTFRFSEGRESIEDDKRSGRPVSSSTDDENILKHHEIMQIDGRLSVGRCELLRILTERQKEKICPKIYMW